MDAQLAPPLQVWQGPRWVARLVAEEPPHPKDIESVGQFPLNLTGLHGLHPAQSPPRRGRA
jgi:hypothetical protein